MRHLLGLGAVGAVGLMVLAGPVEAQEDPAVEVTIEASYDGWVAPNQSYPVFVTVEPEERLQGRVELYVHSPEGDSTLRRVVEIAAGNAERYGFVAPPTLETGLHGLDVAVYDEDGRRIHEQHLDMRGNTDQELVGMLPSVSARYVAENDWVPLAVDRAGVGRPVPLDDDRMALGPLALAPLDQIVTSGDELAEVPDEQQAAIGTWLAAGGQLLVIGEPSLAGEALPADWIPAPGSSVRAGLGTVRSVGDNWHETLLPSPTRAKIEESSLAETLNTFGTIDKPLAEEAKASLRPAGGLGILLLVYVALAGPAVFLVTRAVRRRQLAWVGVPVLALGTTGVVVVGGDDLSSDVRSSQVSVYETSPGGTRATTWSLLASEDGDDGPVGLHMPAGWAQAPHFDELFGPGFADGPGQGRESWAQVGDDGTVEAVATPNDGTFAVVKARGPAPDLAGSLEVTAESGADGEITGMVRNTLDVALSDVVALVGRVGIADVGDLAAGEEREYTISGATEFRWDAPPESQLWPDETGEDGPMAMPGGGVAQVEADGEVAVQIVIGEAGEIPPPPPPANVGDLPVPVPEQAEDSDDGSASDAVVSSAWYDLLRQTGWNYRPLGQVVAVGWTDRLDAPVTATRGAAEVRSSMSAVVARTTVVPAGDRLTDAAVIRSYVRGPNDEAFRLSGRPERTIDESVREMNEGQVLGILYGFDVPDAVGERAVDAQRLTLGVPDRFDAAEVWTTSGWQPLQVTAPGTGRLDVPLPPDAVVGGMVFVRAAVPFGSTQPGHELVLFERSAP